MVEVVRPDKASVKMTLIPIAEKFDRTGMAGSGKGIIWMSDNFDSPEANEEIARLFNESTLFLSDTGDEPASRYAGVALEHRR